ncbi:MAG: flagellin [Myxococcota bacterium]
MGISIVTNVPSLNAQNQLNNTQNALNRSLGRLSSGLRINRASDDAAGLAISEKLKSQIRSMSQAERNAMDAISLLQTAEGAMGEISGILTRMRELSVQAANDTVGSTERGFIDQEISALRDELDRLAEVSDFNGRALIDGTGTGFTFQVGINNTTNDRISVSIADMHASQLGTTTVTGGVGAIDVTSITGAQAALAVLDEAISDVSSGRADLGAIQNRMEVTIANLQTSRENLTEANSRIRDTDVAAETAALTRANILVQAGTSVLAQANQAPQIALSLLGG